MTGFSETTTAGFSTTTGGLAPKVVGLSAAIVGGLSPATGGFTPTGGSATPGLAPATGGGLGLDEVTSGGVEEPFVEEEIGAVAGSASYKLKVSYFLVCVFL